MLPSLLEFDPHTQKKSLTFFLGGVLDLPNANAEPIWFDLREAVHLRVPRRRDPVIIERRHLLHAETCVKPNSEPTLC